MIPYRFSVYCVLPGVLVGLINGENLRLLLLNYRAQGQTPSLTDIRLYATVPGKWAGTTKFAGFGPSSSCSSLHYRALYFAGATVQPLIWRGDGATGIFFKEPQELCYSLSKKRGYTLKNTIN
jgi:hypothetical protein